MTKAQVEFQDIRFDRQTLHGRLLVSALESSLRLDKRLIVSVALTVEAVSECETGRKLPFIEMDVLASQPRNEDVLVLGPGYWYGKDVRIPLFAEEPSAPAAPACIEVDLTFRPFGSAPATSLRVRAMATGPSPVDAGTPLPTQEQDAGADSPPP